MDSRVGVGEDSFGVAEEIVEQVILDVLSRQGFTVEVLDRE